MESVALGFGARRLFEDLNLRVGEEDRIGVVGRNGSGKSSLLRIIAGFGEPNAGAVRMARGLRVGYLPQEFDLDSGRSVIETVLSSVPGKADIECMLETVEQGLATTDDEDELMELSQKLADLHEDRRRQGNHAHVAAVDLDARALDPAAGFVAHGPDSSNPLFLSG